MADSFQGFHSGVMKTIKSALDDDFSSVAIGKDPNYGKLDYPAAQYVPDTSQHTSGTDYGDQHIIFYVFKTDKDGRDFIEKVEKVEESTDHILEQLDQDEEPVQFKPTGFDYLLGEEGGSMLYVIQVTWTVEKIFNWN